MTDGRPSFRMPILCLVTPELSRAFDGSTASLRALVTAAIDAGLDIVQVREPAWPARDLLDLVRYAVQRSRSTRTRVVVNDRVDVAVAAGADGVHLGGRSLSPADVRRIVPEHFVVGCSVHSVEEARRVVAAGPVDYLVAGTVFTSASKPSDTPLLGTDGLSDVVRAVAVPVLAIGGVDLSRAASVAAAGAAGFAAIGLFAAAGTAAMPGVANEARRRFDSITPLS